MRVGGNFTGVSWVLSWRELGQHGAHDREFSTVVSCDIGEVDFFGVAPTMFPRTATILNFPPHVYIKARAGVREALSSSNCDTHVPRSDVLIEFRRGQALVLVMQKCYKRDISSRFFRCLYRSYEYPPRSGARDATAGTMYWRQSFFLFFTWFDK